MDGRFWPPIRMQEEGWTADARLHYECTCQREQETRRALYLDAPQHCPDISISTDVPGFIQEDLAVADVGWRAGRPAVEGNDRRRGLCGESVRLLNLRAPVIPAVC